MKCWQFSLRTLLMLVLVIAAFLGGWTANEWKRQRELEQAQKAVRLKREETLESITPNNRAITWDRQSVQQHTTHLQP